MKSGLSCLNCSMFVFHCLLTLLTLLAAIINFVRESLFQLPPRKPRLSIWC
jgi:hypothetical protein